MYAKNIYQRQIQKWNLGEKSGILIRESYREHEKQEQNEKKNTTTRQNNASRGSKTGIPKRPHYRKAHWHHYWTESESKNNRVLELKWVFPMLIHKDDYKGKE